MGKMKGEYKMIKQAYLLDKKTGFLVCPITPNMNRDELLYLNNIRVGCEEQLYRYNGEHFGFKQLPAYYNNLAIEIVELEID